MLRTRKNTETIGKACRQLREKLGVSVSDVAAECGTSRQMIYRFESGDCDSYCFLYWYAVRGLDIIGVLNNGCI